MNNKENGNPEQDLHKAAKQGKIVGNVAKGLLGVLSIIIVVITRKKPPNIG